MRGPRPITLMLGALAVAGVAKTGSSIMNLDNEPGDVIQSAFISAAFAADSEETATAPQSCSPEPRPICEPPELMLQALSEERDLLNSQKERLAERKAEIEIAEEKLAIDQANLLDLKAELEEMFDRIQKAQTDDVDRLVALYAAMKPKEAAAIMDDLDIEVSVMVLATMPERDAAPILAKLNRTRARAISRIILERSKLPGDQRLHDLKL